MKGGKWRKTWLIKKDGIHHLQKYVPWLTNSIELLDVGTAASSPSSTVVLVLLLVASMASSCSCCVSHTLFMRRKQNA
jgi:hypothetical protein